LTAKSVFEPYLKLNSCLFLHVQGIIPTKGFITNQLNTTTFVGFCNRLSLACNAASFEMIWRVYVLTY